MIHYTADPQEITDRIAQVLRAAPDDLPVDLVYPWRRSRLMRPAYRRFIEDLTRQSMEPGTGSPGSARRLVAVYGTDLQMLLDQWMPPQDPGRIRSARIALAQEIDRRDRIARRGIRVHRAPGYWRRRYLERYRDGSPGLRTSLVRLGLIEDPREATP